MNREELEFQARRILAAAQATLELQSEFDPVFLVHFEEDWKHFPMPPETMHILNVPESKDVLFGFFRMLVQAKKADGVLFATDTWDGEVTPEGRPHYGKPEWRENNTQGMAKLIELGWIKRYEAIVVTAQSATDVLIIIQRYEPRGGLIHMAQSKRMWTTQEQFFGRQKMFGQLFPENIR
jgi:hypothetical protein